jgi:hypothetical protein
MADDKKISQLTVTTKKDALQIPVNDGGLTKNILLKTIRRPRVKDIIENYTGLNNDDFDLIDVNHTSTTGLIQYTLPNPASNIDREITVQNTGDGLTYINGSIVYKGNLLVCKIYLFSYTNKLEK